MKNITIFKTSAGNDYKTITKKNILEVRKNKIVKSVDYDGMLKTLIIILLLVSAFISPFQVAAQLPITNKAVDIVYPLLTNREGKDLKLPIPPNVHPRLYLTSGDIPGLKEKINSPLLADCWNKLTKAAAYKTDGILPKSENINNDSDIQNAIEAKALMYVLYGDENSGREVVNITFNYFNSLNTDFKKKDGTRALGRYIVTGALVYDWCYYLLNTEQKTMLINHMEGIATKMEIKWPNISGSSITGHTVEAQLARDMLSLGIATYDEKPVIYNRVVGRIMAEFLPVRQFFYSAGYHHQGSAYGPYRFYWEMVSTFIFDKMGHPNFYGKDQAKIPYYFIYGRRPDGQMVRDGDEYMVNSAFGKWWNIGQNSLMYSGTYFKDPLVINEALKERKPGENDDYIFDFLFFEPTLVNTEIKKAALPLTRYFKEPYGAMIARTGWEDGLQSSAVVAKMKVQAYNFSNHQHLDAGEFQIYYKGPLTSQSGIYEGKNGGYGSEHFKNYHQRSIAHNTMLINDPEEKFKWHNQSIVNDGGQPYPNEGNEPKNMEELLSKGYKTGEVLAHAFGPDSIKPEFTYLKGELAEAYPKKVKSFKRSFVFLNLNDKKVPAALIIFDRVNSSNKDFKKTWLLHSVEEPKINKDITTIKMSEKGYNGQLVNSTLLPNADNLSITKIGGAGNEYRVGDKNYPQVLTEKNNSGDSVMWRIEVSPKKAALTDHFLNVMQVMDYKGGTSKTLTTTKVENDQFVGAAIADRLVFFSKDGELKEESFSIKISSKSPVKVLVTDIKNGNWKVVCTSNKKQSPGNVSSDKQLLYFTAQRGNYLITKE